MIKKFVKYTDEPKDKEYFLLERNTKVHNIVLIQILSDLVKDYYHNTYNAKYYMPYEFNLKINYNLKGKFFYKRDETEPWIIIWRGINEEEALDEYNMIENQNKYNL